MCYKLEARIAKTAITNSNAYRVGQRLAHHAHSTTRLAWPSISTLTILSKCSLNTARSSLVRLRDQGIIDYRTFGDNWNLYILFPNKDHDAAAFVPLDKILSHLDKSVRLKRFRFEIVPWLVDVGHIDPGEAAQLLLATFPDERLDHIRVEALRPTTCLTASSSDPSKIWRGGLQNLEGSPPETGVDLYKNQINNNCESSASVASAQERARPALQIGDSKSELELALRRIDRLLPPK